MGSKVVWESLGGIQYTRLSDIGDTQLLNIISFLRRTLQHTRYSQKQFKLDWGYPYPTPEYIITNDKYRKNISNLSGKLGAMVKEAKRREK